MAELTKLNPNWEADHKNHLASVTAADVKKRESTNTNVKKIEELGHWINKKPCGKDNPFVDATLIVFSMASIT